MNIYGHEITNEHYKILKCCHGKHHVSYEKLVNKFCSPHSPYSYYRFHDNFAFLRSHDFLSQDNSTDANGIQHFDDKVYISSIGENTYLIMKDKKVLFWKELLLSKWLDIIVSFITAAITCANWYEIAEFFSNLFQK